MEDKAGHLTTESITEKRYNAADDAWKKKGFHPDDCCSWSLALNEFGIPQIAEIYKVVKRLTKELYGESIFIADIDADNGPANLQAWGDQIDNMTWNGEQHQIIGEFDFFHPNTDQNYQTYHKTSYTQRGGASGELHGRKLSLGKTAQIESPSGNLAWCVTMMIRGDVCSDMFKVFKSQMTLYVNDYMSYGHGVIQKTLDILGADHGAGGRPQNIRNRVAMDLGDDVSVYPR